MQLLLVSKGSSTFPHIPLNQLVLLQWLFNTRNSSLVTRVRVTGGIVEEDHKAEAGQIAAEDLAIMKDLKAVVEVTAEADQMKGTDHPAGIVPAHEEDLVAVTEIPVEEEVVEGVPETLVPHVEIRSKT